MVKIYELNEEELEEAVRMYLHKKRYKNIDTVEFRSEKVILGQGTDERIETQIVAKVSEYSDN